MRLLTGCLLTAVLAANALAGEPVCSPAHSGHPERFPFRDPYESKSVRKLEKLGAKGDARALGMLGIKYGTGSGVELDPVKSFDYYRRAAEMGDANAQANLAYMYMHGEGTGENPALAFEWARKSANAGSANGQMMAGYMLGEGVGVEQDMTQSAFCYLLSAKQGYVESQLTLANLFEMGTGVPVDLEQAALWRSRAREARATMKLWTDATPLDGIPPEWISTINHVEDFTGPVTVATSGYSFRLEFPAGTRWERHADTREPRSTILRSGLAGYDTHVLTVTPKGAVAPGLSIAEDARRSHSQLEYTAVAGNADCMRASEDGRPLRLGESMLGVFAYCLRPADRELYEIAVTWKSLTLKVGDPSETGSTGEAQMKSIFESALASFRFR